MEAFINDVYVSSTMAPKRITIINVQPPEKADINTELQWLGAALGLFGERDKDSSCFRVFVTLIKQPTGGVVSSDDIAEQTALTRGTVVHHLNKLRKAGLIAHHPTGYSIREGSLQEALESIQNDINDTMNLLRAVAGDIEKRL